MRIQRVAEGGASARGARRRRTRERESASTVRDTSQHKTFPPGLPATPSGYLRRLPACLQHPLLHFCLRAATGPHSHNAHRPPPLALESHPRRRVAASRLSSLLNVYFAPRCPTLRALTRARGPLCDISRGDPRAQIWTPRVCGPTSSGPCCACRACPLPRTHARNSLTYCTSVARSRPARAACFAASFQDRTRTLRRVPCCLAPFSPDDDEWTARA